MLMNDDDDPLKKLMMAWYDEAIDDVRVQALNANLYAKAHLDNLINRATYVGGSRFSTETYIIASPIPPVLSSNPKQNEAYTMVNTVKRHRFSKEIAEELLAEKGDFAHFYALEKLDTRNNEALWRDVLTWLDELKGESK